MAEFCDCLIHPFQNDPGVTQQQRIMDDLLSGNAKIDARKTADLLDYFSRLSRGINYYDADFNISNWEPFFEKSLPFTLASLIRYDASSVEKKFDFYNLLFARNPSAAGLKLSLLFIFYNTINRINNWHVKVKGSDLPVERVLGNIIQDKLQQPLKDFIWLNNLSSKWFGVDRINFANLLKNDIWKISAADLVKSDDDPDFDMIRKRDRLIALQKKISDLFSAFFEPIKISAASAEQSMEQSLFPLKDELQKLHTPHLGLLFAFLKLFEQLQGDLNTYTKKHLDFFYKEILKLKPKDAFPDSAHIVFEIQKELDNYLLTKGLLLKDGKDDKQADILFSLDDEIVVNKTQVADIRTLYLNSQTVHDTTYLEGVYVAPDATKADGIDKDFGQGQPVNYPTLGSKESKYIVPGTNTFKPYANARLGFVLASPVLLLSEGKRTVTITLQCELDEKICEELGKLNYPLPKKCCEEPKSTTTTTTTTNEVEYPKFLAASKIYEDVVAGLNEEYYYVSQELISNAAKKGLDSTIIDALTKLLVSSNVVETKTDPKPYCYCPTETKKFDTYVEAGDFEKKVLKNPAMKGNTKEDSIDIISEFFKKRKPFKLSFSGEKKWIETNADHPVTFQIDPDKSAPAFKLIIKAVLTDELDAVTFYNKDNLLEDFDTTLPLVKIELDDHYKILYPADKKPGKCCLDEEIKFENDKIPISLYHFFRNVKVEEGTKIDVEVCGLKTFIVQNDENLQDVNSPVFPFGAIPKVGSNFYIGSEEIFLKNWEKLWLNVYWKDFPPKKLASYYEGYEVKDEIKDSDFQMKVSVLQEGNWYIKKHNGSSATRGPHFDQMFPDSKTFVDSPCFSSKRIFHTLYTNQYYFERDNFQKLPNESKKKFNYKGYKKHDATVKDGFMKMTLENRDFLHDVYPFVLAEYMIKLAKTIIPDDGEGVPAATNKLPPRPNKPWTPTINGMTIDYTATAVIKDIDLIHLYPFDGTNKKEEIQLKPALFPTFCDEGTLFIGLSGLVPGENLNILFQLAEATGDSEFEKEDAHWFYLDNNVWKELRTGFEVLDDATKNLTSSGIIKFALPENMTIDNSVMPKDFYWLKAVIVKNSQLASETTGIHAQAMRATFTNDAANDKLRLDQPLIAESISKLNTADASVKTVSQPYETFDGRVPEEQGMFYVRVSELLRHKNRSIQKFDYERIALDAFPELFKVKCLNHSFPLNAHLYKNDFPYAPGYVLLAVIPNLNKLKAGNSYEPKVPVSIIEKIEDLMRKRTSTFVRFRAMNPRYEKIHFCLKVKLILGKDENYYKEKLKDDVRKFIAPWAVGEFYKLTFGQCVNRSDIVQFLETRDYIDFIMELNMRHDTTEDFPTNEADVPVKICPKTPRSILIAGDIDVCIAQETCETWGEGKCDNEVMILDNSKRKK